MAMWYSKGLRRDPGLHTYPLLCNVPKQVSFMIPVIQEQGSDMTEQLLTGRLYTKINGDNLLSIAYYTLQTIFNIFSHVSRKCLEIRISLHHSYFSRLVGKPTMWFPTSSDTNRPVQAQKRARSLKFRI